MRRLRKNSPANLEAGTPLCGAKRWFITQRGTSAGTAWLESYEIALISAIAGKQ